MNRDHAFLTTAIPEIPPGLPNLTLPRDAALRWRRDYLMLLEWASALCRVPVRDLTPLHLVGYLHRGAETWLDATDYEPKARL